MFGYLKRISVIMSISFLLAGCIVSKHDISTEATPVFPLADGQYREVGSMREPFTLTHTGNAYLISSAKADQKEYFRFYRFPEFDNLVVQYWKEPKKGDSPDYVYGYGPVGLEGFTFMSTITGSGPNAGSSEFYATLPPYLANLVEPTEGIIKVKNPARDKLYFLREVGRRGLKMGNTSSYTKAP